MIRQERRKKMRAIARELQWIDKHTPFRKLGDVFGAMPENTLTKLEAGELDASMDGLKSDYETFKKLFKRIIDLNHMYSALKMRGGHLLDRSNPVLPEKANL